MGPLKPLLAFALLVETSAPLLPSSARAEPAAVSPSVGLHWVREAGAEGCFDGATLARRVEQRRGARLFTSPTDAQIVIEGRATRSAEGYRAELRAFEAGGALLGSREVASQRADCAELSEAVAMVLSIMLDPEGALQLAAPAPPHDETSAGDTDEPNLCPEPEAAQPNAPDAASEAAPQSGQSSAELSAFARYAYGHVPAGSFGGGIALELGFKRFGGARFEAAAFAEQSFQLEGDADAGSKVRVLLASVGYCPLWAELGRLRVAGCASLAAGALQSRGFGFEVQRDNTSPMLDVGASLRGALELWGPLKLAAGAGVATPLLRTQLEATDRDGNQVTLFEQDAFAVAVDLGLSCAF